MKLFRPAIPSFLFASAVAAAAAAAVDAQTPAEHPSCAAHPPAPVAAHSDEGLHERGDHVMGFDHAKTTHHFTLTKTGGRIEISANRRDDLDSIGAIRSHLPHIARMFSEGDFEAPMLIHDRVPPGVPTMKRHPGAIAWKYEESAAGGRIVVTTKDAQALSALHAFLAFQIEDHETEDSLAVQ
jgi:hypothetical protein